jgi:hypothetical protein
VCKSATFQDLSDFALPWGLTQGLYWSAPIFQVADFSGRILCGRCTCAPSSSESSNAARLRRALESGLRECQLKRGGSEIVSAKRNRRVRFSG